jgi:hypothetical protein
MAIARHLLTSRATLEPFVGQSGRQPVYGPTQTDIPCNWQPTTKLVVTADQLQITVTGEVFFLPTQPVPVDSMLTVDGVRRRVIASDVLRALNGTPHHRYVLVG